MARNLADSPSELKLGLLILLAALILHLIGFSTESWVVNVYSNQGLMNHTFSFGLWSSCFNNKCISNKDVEGNFTAIQILETLGLSGLILSNIIAVILIFCDVSKTQPARKYVQVKYVCPILSGVLIEIGVIVFGIKYVTTSSRTTGYSLGVSAAAGAGAMIAAFNYRYCTSSKMHAEVDATHTSLEEHAMSFQSPTSQQSVVYPQTHDSLMFEKDQL